MEAPKASSGKKYSWIKLMLFAAGSLVVLVLIAGAVLYSQFGPTLLATRWSMQLRHALDVYENDSEQGKQLIDQTFSDAQANHVGIGSMMALHREYAHYLYS